MNQIAVGTININYFKKCLDVRTNSKIMADNFKEQNRSICI